GVTTPSRDAELAKNAAIERGRHRVELHPAEPERLAPEIREPAPARGTRSRVPFDHARGRWGQGAVDQGDQLALAFLAGQVRFHGFAPRAVNFRLKISCAL